MENEAIQAIASVAETITSIGILLVWIYAERKDNQAAWSIIDALVRLRLKQIEHEYEKSIKEDTKDNET